MPYNSAVSSVEKAELYRRAEAEVGALVAGLTDPVAAMASLVAVVHGLLKYVSWTGFYRVVEPRLLRVGPYQGPVGCLEIPFDRGVCGDVARRGEPRVVEDVEAFEGHIACDPSARSEIVVPVFDSDRRLVAVLDLDSTLPSAFDETDRQGLERIVRLLAPAFDGHR